MANFIDLDIRLEVIKHFLDHVLQQSQIEIKQIFHKYEAGEFAELDGLNNAVFYPVSRQEIAIRAVLFEITALVDHELQMSAQKPWSISKKHKGPKSLTELPNLSEQPDAIRSMKMISDLYFSDVKELIEGHYKIKIDELPGAKFILDIREIVNSFKHRRGAKDFRKINASQLRDASLDSLIETYKPKIEEAYEAIKQTRKFIGALWKATNISQDEKLKMDLDLES